MVGALERWHVAVLTSLGDDDVVNADITGVGRVDPDPGAAEEFDPRVALADNRFPDGRGEYLVPRLRRIEFDER